MNRQTFLLSVVGCCVLSTAAWAKRYNYYLDPSQVEKTFASIALHPPLQNQQWLGLVGEKKNQTYQVKSGDNLWRISQKVLGDPFLWRKLWEVNSDISNPHDLEIGSILSYYREGEGNTLPMVKLRPAGRGVASDLDEDIVLNQETRSRIRVPYVVLPPEAVLGEITGARTFKSGFDYNDEPYVRFTDKSKVSLNDRFAVARVEKLKLNLENKSLEVGGDFLRVVGEIKAIELGQSLVRVEIVAASSPIRRGDKIIPLQPVLERPQPLSPPDGMTVTIISGEEVRQSIVGQGSLVVLNKGTAQGMKPGFYFRVFEDTDPNTESRENIEPYYKAEISVIAAAENSSIGYVVRNTAEIKMGDVAVPFRAFQDPAPKPHREVQQVEID